MFSKNKWAIAGFQCLLTSLQNGNATFFESDRQLFRVDNNLYAGGQPHPPGAKTADMEISYCQYFGGITQAGAYVRPKLSPPVKRPAENEERAFSHLLVLQSQVGFDDGRTTAPPVFVALGCLMNIHFSAAFCMSRIIGALRTLCRSRVGSHRP